MSNSNINTRLNWKLIAFLSFIALARPLMSTLGISDAIGQPVASITATIMISITWIITIFIKQDSQPVLTLILVGVGYGILAIILSGIFSPILTGQLQGPLTNPLAMVSVLVTNSIWGLCAGLITTTLLKIQKKL
jgi:predicted membrane protein